MRIICGISARNDAILRITDTLRHLGHEVALVSTDDFQDDCPYAWKKLDEFGFHYKRNQYIGERKRKIFSLLDSFQPDCILFINIAKHILSLREMQQAAKKTRIVTWFVDSVAKHLDELDYIRCCHSVYVFERSDVDVLQAHGIRSSYCPVGYNCDYVRAAERPKEDIDIAFVGSPFRNRLQILEQVAEYADDHALEMQVHGIYYDRRYFWKKFFFRRKYPHLARKVVNRYLASSEAASLYRRTKICLNIHAVQHRGMNPRSFEILAVGGFELMDRRDDYVDGMFPGKHFETYGSTEELLGKIGFYLKEDAERRRIAEAGYAFTAGKMSIAKGLERILDDLRGPAGNASCGIWSINNMG